MTAHRRVLVAGLPRSGTTWVGRVLGAVEGTTYVHEPDNHRSRPEAWWAKRDLGPYPLLAPGGAAAAPGDYEALFETAFGGGGRPHLLSAPARVVHRVKPGSLRRAAGLASPRPAPAPGGNVVVKSVFCARSLEWLAERFRPAVVVIARHPFSVIASWSTLGWDGFLDRDARAVGHCAEVLGVAPPGRDAPWVDRAAWHYGYLSSLLAGAAARNPAWLTVGHEALCADPGDGFRRLAEALGLGWTDDAAAFLAGTNRSGQGYSTNRVWVDEVEGWKTKLDRSDQDRVRAVLGQFPPFPRVPAPEGDPLASRGRVLVRCAPLALSRVEC